MIHITNKEVYTDLQEKKLHRIGTDLYFSRCTKLPNDTISSFEEINIEDIPQEEINDNEL